jgi:hypothetical protein
VFLGLHDLEPALIFFLGDDSFLKQVPEGWIFAGDILPATLLLDELPFFEGPGWKRGTEDETDGQQR